MGLFRQLHKSAFWSQLLLGVVAILAMPTTQVANEATQSPVEQTLTLSEFSATQQAEIEQIYFLGQASNTVYRIQQAVTFCKFFAKSYRLYALTNPPIRAGPFI